MGASGSDLAVLAVIDSLTPGGTERSLAALVPAYGRLGVTVDVVYLVERPGLHAEMERGGAFVFSLAAATSRPGRVREAARLIRQRRPDLVHTMLFEADLVGRTAARLARTPVVSSVVNTSYGPEHRADPGVRWTRLRGAQALDAATARLAVRLHAVSMEVADVMALRLRYPRQRIDVVPRGRDGMALGRRTAERRGTARATLGVGADDVVVLAVGRHEHQKALQRLVEALPAVRRVVPTARLVIAGREGGASMTIRAAVARLGLTASVTLLGERPDVADLLCAADVFVLPSVREGMPGAVIEAMALETPVVATALPQVREVTGADGAILVVPGDTARLAAGIVECVVDRAAASRRTATARQRFVDHFTIERTAAEMVRFYRRALHPSRF